jgi:hypothetical protein
MRIRRRELEDQMGVIEEGESIHLNDDVWERHRANMTNNGVKTIPTWVITTNMELYWNNIYEHNAPKKELNNIEKTSAWLKEHNAPSRYTHPKEWKEWIAIHGCEIPNWDLLEIDESR